MFNLSTLSGINLQTDNYFQYTSGYVSRAGEDYPLLRINDLLDNNAMLEFAVIGQQYDVLKLSFLGRMKR